MTSEQKKKCHGIIHAASAATAGAGAFTLPFSDNVVITPIQITMIVSLGAVFGQEITESAAKATAMAGMGALIGRNVAKVALTFIPVVGNVMNGAIAAGITESLGWMVAKQLDTGKFPAGEKE